MPLIHADANAFDAYNIIYYPLFGNSDHAIFPISNLESASEPDERDYVLALAMQEELASTPYTLSDSAINTLAKCYAALRDIGGDNFTEAMVNPASDIRDLCPDEPLGKPMYPDFPTQVMEMDEIDYRLHQIRHYMSTYGVEMISRALGMDVTVQEGWLPDVSETEKICEDNDLIEKHVLDIVIDDASMARILEDALARPMRMPRPACALVVDLFEAGEIKDLSSVAFHENMMSVIRSAAKGSSSVLANVCGATAQHPGDILKAILTVAEEAGTNHLATRQKKGFCRALDAFEPISIATNMADLAKRGEKASNMLSAKRFGGDPLNRAIEMVEKREVKSYNARVEDAWKALDAAPDSDKEKSQEALISIYKERPGVMFRALGRMFDASVPVPMIVAALTECEDALSLATLVRFVTIMSAEATHEGRDYKGNLLDEDDAKRRQANATRNPLLAALVAPVLANRLSKIKTPFAGKKVFVDPTGFSLLGSVVIPNATSDASGAYPPVGMAYDIPKDKTVRFFTFWDDSSDRVDVDLHFQFVDAEGHPGSVGWNSSYHSYGMTTSGDIVHSKNAAEYLDIDMTEALESGIETVMQHQHVFTGQPWKDIETCFSGALVVGDKEPDVKLYNSKNILFHDDMTSSGNKMDYALIDVPGHYVRILRGGTIPFSRTAFNLDTFISLLLDAQGSKAVDDAADADIILSVGRAEKTERDGIPVISLIDEKFFIE